MKVDIDSILYIVITIVILVISGLGSRKRRMAQQMQAKTAADSDEDYFEPVEEEFAETRYSQPVKSREVAPQKQAPNPVERLEQFITGRFPQAESMEGESLETPVDEEELILKEIQRSREQDDMRVPEKEPAEQEVQTGRPGKKGLPALFDNLDEVKKAIIYSEIMQRRYR